MSAILASLVKVIGAKANPSENEKPDVHRARVARLAGGLSDEDWKKLNEDAQVWANDALTAINKKKPIPEFPDQQADEPAAETDQVDRDAAAAEPEAAPAAADADDEEDEPVKPAPKPAKPTSKPATKPTSDSKPAASAKPAAAAKTEQPVAESKDESPAKPAPKPAPTSADKEAKDAARAERLKLTKLHRQVVIENPDASRKEIVEMVEKKHGFKPNPNTSDTIYYETRATVALLKELGTIK